MLRWLHKILGIRLIPSVSLLVKHYLFNFHTMKRIVTHILITLRPFWSKGGKSCILIRKRLLRYALNRVRLMIRHREVRVKTNVKNNWGFCLLGLSWNVIKRVVLKKECGLD